MVTSNESLCQKDLISKTYYLDYLQFKYNLRFIENSYHFDEKPVTHEDDTDKSLELSVVKLAFSGTASAAGDLVKNEEDYESIQKQTNDDSSGINQILRLRSEPRRY